MPPTTPSTHALNVLSHLKAKHNVLLTGPPATGKSRLMAEVAQWFTHKSSGPAHNPGSPALFPPAGAALAAPWMPAAERPDHRVWQVTFHQGTKRHDFVNGMIPRPNPTGIAFQVVNGPVLEAATHARSPMGASLLIVDEVNRGPAVAVFGDLIGAIESDKRLAPDGKATANTHTFTYYAPEGLPRTDALPHHLYFLLAMNEADTSVEPIDVAFRRRFFPYRLGIDRDAAATHLALTPQEREEALAATAGGAKDVYRALWRAWLRCNERIELGRSADMQIGHYILMERPPPTTLAGSLEYAVETWTRVQAHVAEVFYGDTRGLAAALNASSDVTTGIVLEESTFADAVVARVRLPPLTPDHIYGILKTVGGP